MIFLILKSTLMMTMKEAMEISKMGKVVVNGIGRAMRREGIMERAMAKE